jgi:uncharacterized cupredoxin-like copper-binding protein
MSKRGTLLLAAGVLALGAAGCGSAKSVVGTNAQVEEPVATVKLTEKEFSFTPKEGVATKSGLISIVASNAGKEYHALRVVVPGKQSEDTGNLQTSSEEIGEIDPGDTQTLNLRLKPGVYSWYCPLSNHAKLGMHGKLRVE